MLVLFELKQRAGVTVGKSNLKVGLALFAGFFFCWFVYILNFNWFGLTGSDTPKVFYWFFRLVGFGDTFRGGAVLFYGGLVLLIWFTIWLIIAIGNIAQAKGYSKTGFIIFAIFLPIIALIVALVLQPSHAKQVSIAESQSVKCPMCAESIKPEAVVCKHCGSSLTPSA